MISQMRSPVTGNLLEIGCGTGQNSFFLARKTGLSVLGTDICVPFIEEARQRFQLPNLRYDVLDFNQAAQFRGETFDYIVGNGILHHLYHHLDDALVNMRRLLKPGGKIIFLEPNLYNPYVLSIFSVPFLRKLAHLEPDEMAFTKRYATKLLQDAGYRNIHVEYKDFLLPGIADMLIAPSIALGAVLERVPVARMMSQSIFISATA
jgi:SAM-dependent methyltransferase